MKRNVGDYPATTVTAATIATAATAATAAPTATPARAATAASAVNFLQFLCNVRISQKGYNSVTLHMAGNACQCQTL